MLVKLMTSENDKSHGSMMLRVGAIAFGLGTLIYTGLGRPIILLFTGVHCNENPNLYIPKIRNWAASIPISTFMCL
jgi:hypothetical protein